MTKQIKIINGILLFALTAVFISGMLLHPFGEAVPLKIIHALSALVFCAGAGLHVVQHKKKPGEAGKNVS